MAAFALLGNAVLWARNLTMGKSLNTPVHSKNAAASI